MHSTCYIIHTRHQTKLGDRYLGSVFRYFGTTGSENFYQLPKYWPFFKKSWLLATESDPADLFFKIFRKICTSFFYGFLSFFLVPISKYQPPTFWKFYRILDARSWREILVTLPSFGIKWCTSSFIYYLTLYCRQGVLFNRSKKFKNWYIGI